MNYETREKADGTLHQANSCLLPFPLRLCARLYFKLYSWRDAIFILVIDAITPLPSSHYRLCELSYQFATDALNMSLIMRWKISLTKASSTSLTLSSLSKSL